MTYSGQSLTPNNVPHAAAGAPTDAGPAVVKISPVFGGVRMADILE